MSEMASQMSVLTSTLTIVLNEQKEIREAVKANAVGSTAAPVASGSLTLDLPCIPKAEPCETVTLCTGARVTTKLCKAARAGEYINLLEFIPNVEPNQTMETIVENDQIVCRPKKSKRSLDNYFMWAQAWAGYESLLVETDPSLYLQLATYRLFVQEQDQKFKWPHVHSYDSRHRASLAINHSFDFARTSMEIFVSTCVSNDTKRANEATCYRCHSLLHFAKDCPLSEGTQVEKSTPVRRASSRGRGENGARQDNRSSTGWNGQSGKTA